MEHVAQIGKPGRQSRSGALARLLAGHRFTVCQSAGEAARAFDVRRRVYREECGYDVPVPDDYDARSWFLLAQRTDTGAAVGSIRITSRAAGLSAEGISTCRAVAQRRRGDATSRSYRARTGRSLMPAVALGLFKATMRVLALAGIQRAVVCAKPERVWTYAWMCFRETGVRAPYAKLGGALHELMLLDFRYGAEIYEDHRFYEFFAGSESSEIELPARVPQLGVHLSPAAAALPLARTA
jgi:hypothetical protein